MSAVHSVPVVHGDITGANILIDERGRAKLIDFGLSTVVAPLFGQSHLAITSIHAGAIHYAAPELLSDDVNVNDLPLEKTDIYSFGCVMLQVSWLFGHKIFTRGLMEQDSLGSAPLV
ncbi:kinase-like domain-containing protein [Suillus discolor]|uniref:Kinase-like domain-containing protein n=1 Tax=Suillus discolor TaxID=1912936 RepID=A0A9P7JV02_9AGAM|nr:kinase-like domain-containing protein [Suillus discolor]KAG2109858.1 kinase-like domain-containing protein [Suillus discolor]